METLIFILDLDGEVNLEELNGIFVRLLQRRVEYKAGRIRGICVVNHQRWLAPIMRQVHRELDNVLDSLLQSCDLSLVFATDLARYLKGALDYKWPLKPICKAMASGGYVSCEPPGTACVGEVIRVFPRLCVIGMHLETKRPLRRGEQIVVRSNAGFEVLTVDSLAVGKQILEEVYSGEVGVKVAFDVKKIIEGSYVYLVDSSLEASESSPVHV